MKTVQIVTRPMGELEVQQRTSDGYFEAYSLLRLWSLKFSKAKNMNHFLDNKSTKEFIETLKDSESHTRNSEDGEFQAVIVSKGRMTKNGKTQDKLWMHPYLFIDFALWLSPTFKLTVIKFVYDQMIKFRIEAGLGYPQLTSSIARIYDGNNLVDAISRVAKGINFVVYGKHEQGIRNIEGTEQKIMELAKLQEKIVELIKEGFITTYPQLIKYLGDRWKENHQPKVLRVI